MKLLIAAAAMMAFAAAAPSSAAAQIGYPPTRSPYIDLEHTQEITGFAGYYNGRSDPAGVAPRGGPIFGAHYSWRVGGPAHLTSEFAYIRSTRHILDPAKPPATRDLGESDWPLYAANVGLALSLTGAKSWHHVVPEVQGSTPAPTKRGRAPAKTARAKKTAASAAPSGEKSAAKAKRPRAKKTAGSTEA